MSHFEHRRLVDNMCAQMWLYFIALFVFFVSLKPGNATRKPHGINTTKHSNFEGKGVVVEGNNNVLNLCHDQEIKTALTQIQKALVSLEERISIEKACSKFSKPCKFDFEAGLHDWKMTGTAFNNQPTYGDNPTARHKGQPANQQGDWWIGGYENRPSNATTAGKIQGDGPQGTLTSPFFKTVGKQISFLIGGGCDSKTVRAELIVGQQVVKKATGACNETMKRKFWDVSSFVGMKARVKLVDLSSGDWGHINFDDLKGDISCA